MKLVAFRTLACLLPVAALLAPRTAAAQATPRENPTANALAEIGQMKVGKLDWPQWGGWTGRNNTPEGKNIPTEWDIKSGKNIKWKANLGSQTYGNPVVANGKVYVGTNNGAGWVKRFPADVDLGCLLCFDEQTGKFLWQHSSPKLPTGRVHDWPQQGICCSPLCEGDRLWYVTSRGEVVCLDVEGFKDQENDGPYKGEEGKDSDDADIVWRFDMMGTLGVSQHNMCSCSVTAAGNILFVCTSNGVDESHINIPAPQAPSFLAMERDTGKVLWTDKSPGTNIVHGQWSSPAYGVLGGVPQVLFCGGDGYLRSFAPEGDGKGNSKLYWQFDANPKTTKWILGGRGTRNDLIGTPVLYGGLVYVATGEDPEHGEGPARVWCIDPAKRGDVSATLAYDKDGKLLPDRRLQRVDTAAGEVEKPNPNSAVVWHYTTHDINKNGKVEFEETMHRTIGTVAIKDDLLFVADFSGLVHCLDAKTGVPHWTHDMFAASWGSPLIVDGKVYIGDEDGDVSIFPLSGDPKVALKKGEPALGTINMDNSVYSTPVVANNVLYIANKSTLFAISASK